MSLSAAEQVLISAAQVAATTFCDFDREERAVGLIREVLPAIPVDAARAVYAIRVHAEAMAGANDKVAKDEYDAARRLLRAALVDFFEQRMAVAYMSWRGPARDVAEG
jgi:hypothetical protein